MDGYEVEVEIKISELGMMINIYIVYGEFDNLL